MGFEIKSYLYLNSEASLSELDYETLSLAYGPLVGFEGIGLYLSLYELSKRQALIRPVPLETLTKLLKTTNLSLYEGKKGLEAMGLLETKYLETSGQKYYELNLLQPYSPARFFSHPLFYGLLKQVTNDAEAEKIRQHFIKNPFDDSKFVDQSLSFTSYYGQLFKLRAIHENNDIYRDTTYKDITIPFDKARFEEVLLNDYQRSSTSFTKDDYESLERLILIFGINEDKLAYIASLAMENNHLNLEKIEDYIVKYGREGLPVSLLRENEEEKYFSTSDKLNEKIELYNRYSPYDYLMLANSGTKVAPQEVRLINKLSKDYDFPGSVINAIIDFTLLNCQNELPEAYALKIASSLKRNNVRNGKDALNQLYVSKKKREKASIDSLKGNFHQASSLDDMEEVRDSLEDDELVEDPKWKL